MDEPVKLNTILRSFQDPNALIRWAWNLGKEGKSLEEACVERSPGAFHADLLVNTLSGEPLRKDAPGPVRQCVEWAMKRGVRITARDAVHVKDGVSVMTHEGVMEGAPVAISIRHGDSLYPDDFIVPAAGAMAIGSSAALIIRFAKTHGSLSIVRILSKDEIEAGWRHVLTLFTAYRERQAIKAALKHAGEDVG